MAKAASDLLTPEKAVARVTAAEHSKNLAIIMALSGGGFRIGDLGQLRRSDDKFVSYGAVVNVNAKTGKARYIRIVMSVGLLVQGKKYCPFEPVGEARVFLTAARSPLPPGPSTNNPNETLIPFNRQKGVFSSLAIQEPLHGGPFMNYPAASPIERKSCCHSHWKSV